ncbi:unnamed protein product [Adineta ricciae]|uniref:Aminoglycoside phosphotransferase domain-containing protein n=1 Tax=Adineta ricciae TaxID=249248 RepID=A0A815TTA2_ADIRI|nr:unnamed protein product [Adineta ricciae]CAF1510997.1 unnamed protein product [Adineta ricciae]
MEFLMHPTYGEQCEEVNLILSKVTKENLDKLLQRLDLHCVLFEHLKTSGRINFIFHLETQSKSFKSQELILKVSNPHRYWRRFRTRNEVFTMKYVLQHTTIPVPKILDYSDDSTTSILSAEYILMEKLPGNTLEVSMKNMSEETLFKITLEMIDYVKQLRRIKLSGENQIGSFSDEEMSLGGIVEDSPMLGPFSTVKEYIIGNLHWAIKRIQTDEFLFELTKHLLSPLETVVECIQRDPNVFNENIPFRFTHTDLNSSNILVNEHDGHVLGILDWEKAAMTFSNNDLQFTSAWFDDDDGDNNDGREKRLQDLLEQEKSYTTLMEDKVHLKELNWYLEIMFSAVYVTFYSCTWFKNEEEVTEHIQYYVQKTEEAISSFNKDYFFKNMVQL